jgi:hypothetical protein
MDRATKLQALLTALDDLEDRVVRAQRDLTTCIAGVSALEDASVEPSLGDRVVQTLAAQIEAAQKSCNEGRLLPSITEFRGYVRHAQAVDVLPHATETCDCHRRAPAKVAVQGIPLCEDCAAAAREAIELQRVQDEREARLTGR